MTIIRPGMRVWHKELDRKQGGTIGAIAQLKGGADSRRFIISCAHVLAPKEFNFVPKKGDRVFAGKNGGGPVATLIGYTDYITDEVCVEAAIAEIDPNLANANPNFKGAGPITGVSRFRTKGLTLYARDKKKPVFRTATIEGEDDTAIKVTADSASLFGDNRHSGAFALNKFHRAVGMIQSKVTGTATRFLLPVEVVMAQAALAAGFSADALEIFTGQENADLHKIESAS